MASGGMDTLPHNGAVITLLAVTGLTHKQYYGDIFAITLIKKSSSICCYCIIYMVWNYLSKHKIEKLLREGLEIH